MRAPSRHPPPASTLQDCPMIELLRSSPIVLAALAAVFGLLIGSFLNVVIHRLPRVLNREWRAQALEVLTEWGREKDAPDAVRRSSEGLEDAHKTLVNAPRYNLVVPRSACPKCGHQI